MGFLSTHIPRRVSFAKASSILWPVTSFGAGDFDIARLCRLRLPHKVFRTIKADADRRFGCSFLLHAIPRSDPMSTPYHHSGYKFSEVFQLKQAQCSELLSPRFSEMMKSNSFLNFPTLSLLSFSKDLLDESILKKNGEIPQRAGCLLKEVVQEIERRIATQTEHNRLKNNQVKSREDKYQSRIKTLKTLSAEIPTGQPLVLQVALLEETLARKDEEIDHLHMLLDVGTVSSNMNNKKHEKSMLRHSSSSPEISFKDNNSCRSEISFQQIIESKQKRESLGQPKDSGEERGRTYANMELLDLNGADSEELSSDISDGDLITMGKETERSAASSLFPEHNKSIDNRKQRMSKVASRIAKSLQERAAQTTPPRPKFKATSMSTTSKETLRPPALRDTIRTSNSKDSPKSPSMKKISTSPAAFSSGKIAANH